MPIIMGVDHEEKRVSAVAIGSITVADVERHLLAEGHFGGLAFKELIDARAAAIVWTTHEVLEIVEIVRRVGQKSKFGPTAVLVSTDNSFEMIRKLELSLEGLAELRPFRHQQEAETWLGERIAKD